MKKIVIALALALVALLCLGGCQPKYVGRYDKSRIEEIRVKTNKLDDYHVKYSVTQKVTLKNVDDTKEPVFWESVFKIEDGVFKKHKGDYNKYSFTGKLTKKRPPDVTDSVTKNFKQYNDGEHMYLEVGGETADGYPKDSNYNDSTYSVTDKLPVDFYNENKIDTISEYRLHDGGADYVFAYLNSDEDTTVAQALFNSPEKSYWLPSINNVKYHVSACQAEVFTNKAGYIVKQLVTVKIDIVSGRYNGVNAKGEATLSMKIEYVKPGSSVKL